MSRLPTVAPKIPPPPRVAVIHAAVDAVPWNRPIAFGEHACGRSEHRRGHELAQRRESGFGRSASLVGVHHECNPNRALRPDEECERGGDSYCAWITQHDPKQRRCAGLRM